MKYVLRWFIDQNRCDYLAKIGGFTREQKEAKHYGSKAEALADVNPLTCCGADGPFDRVGWKAVRLTKKVTAAADDVGCICDEEGCPG